MRPVADGGRIPVGLRYVSQGLGSRRGGFRFGRQTLAPAVRCDPPYEEPGDHSTVQFGLAALKAFTPGSVAGVLRM